jgi:hypothetical protein
MLKSVKKALPPHLYSEPLPARHSSSIGPMLHPFLLSSYCRTPLALLSTVVQSSTPLNAASSSPNRHLTVTPWLGELRRLLSLSGTLPVHHRCRERRPRHTFLTRVPLLTTPPHEPSARSPAGSAPTQCRRAGPAKSSRPLDRVG